MEPTKVTPQSLQKIIDNLINGAEDSRGSYLYRGFRLQISTYQASGAERTSRLYHKRRELGLCIRCGKKVTEKNPKTGKLYRLCDQHKNMIDTKNISSRKSVGKKAGKSSKKRK